MNAQDYINWIVGKPYKQGADGPDEFDCWGVIPHSFLEVDGIAIPKATDRQSCNLDSSAKVDVCHWMQCDRDIADIFCCYSNGQMVHIGRILDGKALHAAGHLTNGMVAVWPWRKVELVYKDVRYFKYAYNLG